MSDSKLSEKPLEQSIENASKEKILTPAGREKVVWSRKRILMVVLFSIIVLLSIALLIMIVIDKTFLFELVRDYFIAPLIDIGYWKILVFIILMILQSLLVPIPSELILLSGGMIFGILWGTVLGVIGSLLSGVLTYFIAKKGGRPILEATGEHIGLIDKFTLVMDIWIRRWGIWAIIAGRAVPVVMFDPISYAAGISNIKWKEYTLATFIGSIPRAIFYAFLGDELLGNEPLSSILTMPTEEFEAAAGRFNLIFFIIFGVLILMLVVATIVSNRVQRKKTTMKQDDKKETGGTFSKEKDDKIEVEVETKDNNKNS